LNGRFGDGGGGVDVNDVDVLTSCASFDLRGFHCERAVTKRTKEIVSICLLLCFRRLSPHQEKVALRWKPDSVLTSAKYRPFSMIAALVSNCVDLSSTLMLMLSIFDILR